jgi:hypothetical protein
MHVVVPPLPAEPPQMPAVMTAMMPAVPSQNSQMVSAMPAFFPGSRRRTLLRRRVHTAVGIVPLIFPRLPHYVAHPREHHQHEHNHNQSLHKNPNLS